MTFLSFAHGDAYVCACVCKGGCLGCLGTTQERRRVGGAHWANAGNVRAHLIPEECMVVVIITCGAGKYSVHSSSLMEKTVRA